MSIVLLNAFNPLGTNMNPRGVESLFDLWKDHAPPNADKGGQDVVWLSRADCSVKDELGVKLDEAHAFNEKASGIMRRSACDALLASFCPLKAVDVLVNYRKLAPDFCGVIAFDHELPAWCSAMHNIVYDALADGIRSVYGNVRIYEYAALPTDFVRSYNGRGHEVAVMDKLGEWSPCGKMPHLYVPDDSYIKDIGRWSQMCCDNVKRWPKSSIVAINPIMQTGPAWSDGQPVPVPAMTAIVEAAADAGMLMAIWQAAATEREFDAVCKAIAASVIPAVAAVEGRK